MGDVAGFLDDLTVLPDPVSGQIMTDIDVFTQI
jgi:hypothetical protein